MVIVEMEHAYVKMDTVEVIVVFQQTNHANVQLNVFEDVYNNVHQFMTYKEQILPMIVIQNAHKLVFHNVAGKSPISLDDGSSLPVESVDVFTESGVKQS